MCASVVLPQMNIEPFDIKTYMKNWNRIPFSFFFFILIEFCCCCCGGFIQSHNISIHKSGVGSINKAYNKCHDVFVIFFHLFFVVVVAFWYVLCIPIYISRFLVWSETYSTTTLIRSLIEKCVIKFRANRFVVDSSANINIENLIEKK